MKPLQPKQRWQQLLRQALADQPVPDGPHPVRDDNLVACWLDGRLAAAESDAFWDHLALCPECRETLLLIVELQPDPEDHAAPARSVPAVHRTWSRGPLAVLLAMAACVAVALGIYWLRPEPLELARIFLKQDNPALALQQLESVLGDHPDHAEAQKLAEEAGYRLARKQLLARQFDAVLATRKRLSSWHVDSDRLASLGFQAEHRLPAEVSLALARGLTDYQYELDGSAPAKGVPPVLPLDVEAFIHRVLEPHPRSVPLHLNLAHWLFQQGLKEDAFKIFAKAAQIDPTDALAHIGLGLIHYDWEEYARAHEQFAAALRSRPDDPQLHVNMAMTLERLHRDVDALASWRQAQELARDDDLKKRIDDHLRKRLKN